LHFSPSGHITNSQRDQLPVGLIAQLVEHCTGIAEFESHSSMNFFSSFNSTAAQVVLTPELLAGHFSGKSFSQWCPLEDKSWFTKECSFLILYAFQAKKVKLQV